MQFDWLPKELITKCNFFVASYHRTYGGSLPQLLWQRETMIIVRTHGDLLALLGSAAAARKISVGFGVAVALVLVLAAVLNWWIALALVPSVFAAIYFERRETEFHSLIAAILLAFEVLVDDVAGWGTRFPNARQEARMVLNSDPPNKRTKLLDIYLPNRADLDPTFVRGFGPSG